MRRRRLFVAIGNTLRGDDGVAASVLPLLTAPGECLKVQQLTPEIADEIAAFDEVVFLDADATPGAEVVVLQPLTETTEIDGLPPRPLSHHLSPSMVVEAAQVLFGFQGKAWLCRIPARDFRFGTALSAAAQASARLAATLLNTRFGSR